MGVKVVDHIIAHTNTLFFFVLRIPPVVYPSQKKVRHPLTQLFAVGFTDGGIMCPHLDKQVFLNIITILRWWHNRRKVSMDGATVFHLDEPPNKSYPYHMQTECVGFDMPNLRTMFANFKQGTHYATEWEDPRGALSVYVNHPLLRFSLIYRVDYSGAEQGLVPFVYRRPDAEIKNNLERHQRWKIALGQK